MKKIIFLSLLVLLTCTLAFAEGSIGAGKIGVFASESNFLLQSSDEPSLDFRAFLVGAEYFLTENISLKPGLLFYMNDIEFDPDGGDSYKSDENDIFGGIIGANYYHQLNKGLFVYAGPEFAYIRGNFIEYQSNEEKDEHTESNGIILNGIVGTKYLFNTHAALYIETGLRYCRTNYKNSYYDINGDKTSETKRTISTVDLIKPVIGVNIYFN